MGFLLPSNVATLLDYPPHPPNKKHHKCFDSNLACNIIEDLKSEIWNHLFIKNSRSGTSSRWD